MGASMKHRVSSQLIRKIIREELAVVVEHGEGDDAADAKERSKLIATAGDLMKSINGFKEKATESMKSHVEKQLDDLYKILLDMSNNPHAYVDKQIVSTEPVKKRFKAEGDVLK
jgi:hypothetical protein